MRIIGKIFAVLFSMIYLVILTVLMVASFSLNLLSGNYYANIIKSVDLKTVKLSDFSEFFDDEDFGANDHFDENTTVEGAILEYFMEGGVPRDIALDVINNKKIREVAGKYIGEYMNYQVTGERPIILRKDIEDVFNEPAVIKLLESGSEKIVADDINIDKIYNELNDLVNEMVEGKENYYGNSRRNNENNIIKQ